MPPDTKKSHLLDFLIWAYADLLKAADAIQTSSYTTFSSGLSSTTIDQYRISGIMQCLTYLTQFATRQAYPGHPSLLCDSIAIHLKPGKDNSVNRNIKSYQWKYFTAQIKS
ncbi:unnamed protein product [Albugo candida]|uniref:Uncharacterized protein n=1 Tax=Albugo candida TaxID=65357 RepID=A0A024FTZ5_9STRA|nr:unnamed protein product [Albugo candida]|eukprot:CCI10595.1 unnamed protein product [Albugo candida]